MINIACLQEGPITAVCASQTIDRSVQDIILNRTDWVILHKLLEFFAIFVHATKKLQASHYPSMNYAIPQFLKMIKRVIEKQVEWGATSALGIGCQMALDKLNEYFTEYIGHGFSSIATICDPRFNFNVFGLVFENNREENIKKAKLKSHFKTCFYRYQDRENDIRRAKLIQEQLGAPETQDNEAEVDDDESDAELYRKGPYELDTETELTKYLKQPLMDRKTNIYQYWKAKQFEFPIISKIARDHLAMPATSAPSECVFSVGGDIVTKKRNRLAGESVRMIVCLKN
jgi:hypothetical protein